MQIQRISSQIFNILITFICIYHPPLIYSSLNKKTICLNMIVRNESHVIQRALLSVKPLIDYWVIVDTGSTDNTQNIIYTTLKDIPGKLYQKQWINFAFNRNEALMLAKDTADYILFLDADDWLEYKQNTVLSDLAQECYTASWVSHHARGFSYIKPLIVRSSLPWSWEGVIHEYLKCDIPYSYEHLSEIQYVFSGEGHRSKNPDKFKEAAHILEIALSQEPNNSRYMFYLGESYRDAGLNEEALVAYTKRSLMGGWKEEMFWSLLQIAHLKRHLNYPHDVVVQAYHAAHLCTPYRSEPIYYLAELYNEHGEYALSYSFIKTWQALYKESHHDNLFKLDWIDTYGLLFQLSIASYYVKHYQESLDLHDLLLSMKHLPTSLRTQVELNRQFSLHHCLRP
jgi:glycosyltransferase involved in cell wall biosynthesis